MITHEPDAYRLLGVSVRADVATIRERYLALSRVFHPDRAGGSSRATAAFQRVASAYRTLSDQSTRDRHDRELMLREPLRLAEDTAAERALDAIGQVSERMRERRRALPSQQRGRDLWAAATVPFPVAVLGGPWSVAVAYRSACKACDATGSVDFEREPHCHVCGGSGELRVGLRREPRRCGFCEGRGSVLLRPCDGCGGGREVGVERDVGVEIPPRCRDRGTLRVRGGGEEGRHGGGPGDLVVEVHLGDDTLLSLDGDDVICRLPLTWAQATCGATVDVPSLEGIERLRIPAPISSGAELRVPGRGAPCRTQHKGPQTRGDLRYRIEIDTPVGLSDEERARVVAFDQSLPAAAWRNVARLRKRATSPP